MTVNTLLNADEPCAVEIIGDIESSDFVLLCEHASNRIPRRLENLGLPEEALNLHVAVDIGTRDLAIRLAARLGSAAVLQNYSRLVCDCNRAVTDIDYIVETSDRIPIPGNQGLSHAQRQRRTDEIYWPFHRAVTSLFDRRQAASRRTVVVAVHSFTPVMSGNVRPWHVGVLYVQQSDLSQRLLDNLRRDRTLVVGDNEPYSLLRTYSESMNRHGIDRDLPAFEIEVRQDLLACGNDCEMWADRLCRALCQAGIS
jgi:predicted N-formylglutamate amidohydrolase